MEFRQRSKLENCKFSTRIITMVLLWKEVYHQNRRFLLKISSASFSKGRKQQTWWILVSLRSLSKILVQTMTHFHLTLQQGQWLPKTVKWILTLQYLTWRIKKSKIKLQLKPWIHKNKLKSKSLSCSDQSTQLRAWNRVAQPPSRRACR